MSKTNQLNTTLSDDDKSELSSAAAETPATTTTTTTTKRKARADITVMRRLTRSTIASFESAALGDGAHEHEHDDKGSKSKRDTKSSAKQASSPFAQRLEAAELSEGGELEHVIGRVVVLQHMAVEALKCMSTAIESYIVRRIVGSDETEAFRRGSTERASVVALCTGRQSRRRRCCR